MWTRWFASADSPHSSRASNADAVQRLRVLAAAVGIGVGKDVDAVEARDRAALAPRVARQPRVAPRMEVARHDGRADRKARRRPGLADGVLHPPDIGRRARRQGPGEGGRGRRIGPLAEERRARPEILLAHHALFHEDPGDPVEPFLVVGGAQVVAGVHPLDAVAELVDVVDAARPARPHHGDDGRLPRRVEDGLVVLALDGPEALHPTQIVHAVHPSLPPQRILALVANAHRVTARQWVRGRSASVGGGSAGTPA